MLILLHYNTKIFFCWYHTHKINSYHKNFLCHNNRSTLLAFVLKNVFHKNLSNFDEFRIAAVILFARPKVQLCSRLNSLWLKATATGCYIGDLNDVPILNSCLVFISPLYTTFLNCLDYDAFIYQRVARLHLLFVRWAGFKASLEKGSFRQDSSCS